MKPFIRKEITNDKYIDAIHGNTVEIKTTVFLFGIPIFKSIKLIFD